MIRHMRHGSPPRLLVLQSILSPNRRESLPAPSAGDRIRGESRSSLVAHRAQARALEIESQAKLRLADEYDAAQERGGVRRAGNPNCSGAEQLPGPDDLGSTRKQVHGARQFRDAEPRPAFLTPT